MYAHIPGGFLVAQMVKKLPAMQETWVQSQEGLAGGGHGKPHQHSCQKFHGQRSLVGYGHEESDVTE